MNRLQDEGDRLVELKHPASAMIQVRPSRVGPRVLPSLTLTFGFQAQRDTVRGEWQKFLNLCICQETHLDNVEEFKRVRDGAGNTFV